MEYLDLDIEISPGKHSIYPVVARGQGNTVHIQMRFPFDPQHLFSHLKDTCTVPSSPAIDVHGRSFAVLRPRR